MLGGMCARRGARYSCVETSELEKPRYLPRVVDIDGVGGGCLGQARHGHHIAGEYYVKTSTGTRDDFPNMQGVAFRSTELTGIIGEGILRLRNHHGHGVPTIVFTVLQVFQGLLGVLDIACTVDFLRNGLDGRLYALGRIVELG